MVTVQEYTKEVNGKTIVVPTHTRGDRQSNRLKDPAPKRTPEQLQALRKKFKSSYHN